MGRRGPAKKPTALKLADGTHKPSRDGDPAREPKPQLITKLPNPPTCLHVAGKKVWRHDGGQLVAVGLLTQADLSALTIYCKKYDEVAECERVIKKDGAYQVSNTGRYYAHPAIARKQSAESVIYRYQREFGLTASARSGLQVDTPASSLPSRQRA